MSPLRSIALCSLLIVGRSFTAEAAFETGDVIAGGQHFESDIFITSFGRFDWFLPDGTLNKRMAAPTSELPYDFTFDSAGQLYSVTSISVRRFDRTGNPLGNFGFFGPFTLSSMTFSASGAAYIAAVNPDGNLAKVSSSGAFVRGYLLPNEGLLGSPSVWSVDLAANQCTIFYTSGGTRILRYDVCLSQSLSDFNSSLPNNGARGLRILSDGGVLVADQNAVYRLNAAGSVVQTYDQPSQDSWFAVALDADGRSFWATSQNTAFRFDIASGGLLSSFNSSDYDFTAIAVVGEPRAGAGPPFLPAPIPMTSAQILALLAASLIIVAMIRLHRFVG